MKQTIKFFLLAVTLMIAGVVAHAQVTTASISGRVSDKDGAVAGAPVVAVYQPTGATYFAVTDKNGSYRINGLVPGGPYTVTVDLLGYRTVENQGIYAPLGEVVSVNATLEEESLNLAAAVFVADGNDSGFNVSRAGAGTSVSQRTMNNLPSVNRSMNDVMALTPQASSTTSGLAVGGGNYRSSYVTVDGAAFNNAFGIGSNLPAGGSPISLDAIEQMSVNITPFDVRLSGFTGGAINAVTKSCTNEYKASVYNYYTSNAVRGGKVAGEDIVNGEFLNNTTGFTVGGPIIKNKLFLFLNGEYTMDNTPGSNKVLSDGDGRVGANFKPGETTVRPTKSFMDEVKDYLSEKYNYNPGRYQGYSLSTPDYKLMARLDWIINDANKLNVRFSHTHTSYSSSPSNSISPLASSVYDRNTYGRTSDYAMYFESQRYFQEQNFTSVAAELNSRINDMMSNTLRITWSHQNEPRSYVGDPFPTVDILENYNGNKAVLTSFGPDPFTYGNLRDVQTIVATDELSFTAGIHNLVAGLQFEYDNTKNGYMQGGLGYYVYNSWEDFKAGGKPAAFAITHSNRDDLAQVYPSFNYMQYSLYAQDEINVSDNFKLTAGLRLELPVYPNIPNNENKEYLEKVATSTTMAGTSTADMPKARLNVSPRVGFNWDVLRDRSVIVRGGSGLYTGRIPFVWIVSAAGNSNNLQAQYIDSDGTGANTPNFHAKLSDILKDVYGGSFKAQDLAAPTAATIMDKNLVMPTTWKSSLAVDARLPFGIKGTLEGIFNYDVTTVQATRLGYTEGTQRLPGEPEDRSKWTSEGIKNSQNGNIAPYYLTNSDKHGYYYSVTAQLQKDFAFGLNVMAAYTRSASKGIQEGYGDQVSSLFNGGNYSVNGSNHQELGNSAFVSPNRLIANVSYRLQEGKNFATTFGLFYEGLNLCYIGSYSYSRHSYVMDNVTGEGGSANLLYIPTDKDLESMPFVDNANKDAFKAFIEGDKYLSSHRGEYSVRGAVTAPWLHRFNLKIAQDFTLNIANRPTTLQIGVDILNVANLLNSNWGLVTRYDRDNILAYNTDKNKGETTPTYKFTAPNEVKYKSTVNTWQALFSARLFF